MGEGGGGATTIGTDTSVATSGAAAETTVTPTAPAVANVEEIEAGGMTVRAVAACWIESDTSDAAEEEALFGIVS